MAEPWMAGDDQRGPACRPPGEAAGGGPAVRTRAARPRTLPGRDALEGRGKKILFINQYYWPDHASTAQHLADLAESMAERGYECHVLCARGRYQPGEPESAGLRGPRGRPHPPGSRDLARAGAGRWRG